MRIRDSRSRLRGAAVCGLRRTTECSPPVKFSKDNHLATEVTQVQQVKNGRWVLVKDNLLF